MDGRGWKGRDGWERRGWDGMDGTDDPHLRLPGERLPGLEAALQPLSGAVPALPVVAESLQLQPALPGRLLLLRPPPPPPPVGSRRAGAEPGAEPELRGPPAPPARRFHHGGGRAAAAGPVFEPRGRRGRRRSPKHNDRTAGMRRGREEQGSGWSQPQPQPLWHFVFLHFVLGPYRKGRSHGERWLL